MHTYTSSAAPLWLSESSKTTLALSSIMTMGEFFYISIEVQHTTAGGAEVTNSLFVTLCVTFCDTVLHWDDGKR